MDYIVWCKTCDLIEIFCLQCFFGPFVTAPLGFVLFGSHLWFLTHLIQVWELFALPYIGHSEPENLFLLLPFSLCSLNSRVCIIGQAEFQWAPHVDPAAKFFWLWAEWRLGPCHSFAAVKLKECCMACWKLLSGLRWGVYEGVCRELRVL